MSKWSKEDKSIYNNSEVFKELEKATIDNIYRLDIISKKSNLNPQTIKDIGNAAKEALPAIKELKQNINSAKDHESESDNVSNDDLKDNVVQELEKIKEAALKEGNKKLAYHVERTLEEILSVEVP
jgi:Sec-independent protein translocase protein TatA